MLTLKIRACACRQKKAPRGQAGAVEQAVTGVRYEYAAFAERRQSWCYLIARRVAGGNSAAQQHQA